MSAAGFIYLASASPRRHELLTQLGVRCEIIVADIDETLRSVEAPADYVQRMAGEKAAAVLGRVTGRPAPVLGADTTVVAGDRVLGKPRDRDDGLDMLRLLSGREHEVLSAVAVMDGQREAVALSRTAVRFRALDEAEMRAYWDSGEPRDKAGGYAIQGLGAVFIESIHGSYSGVMGLPLFETARLLDGFGYRLM